MTLIPFWRWYDLWCGFYLDVEHRTVYVCPVPMLGIKIVCTSLRTFGWLVGGVLAGCCGLAVAVLVLL